ncbi:MAG: cysteine--tRNA ligase, partial [Trebonia sp.]
RPHTEAVVAAFSDGLDAKSALRVLADLDADGSVPDGVKFETFAAADRMFGLDLARDIGK